MEENKIPTWEEMEASGNYDDYSSMARTFARLHVKLALKAAAQNADAYNKPKFEGDINPAVDLESILTAYPESNIK
jgi:hypothetical protein